MLTEAAVVTLRERLQKLRLTGQCVHRDDFADHQVSADSDSDSDSMQFNVTMKISHAAVELRDDDGNSYRRAMSPMTKTNP